MLESHDYVNSQPAANCTLRGAREFLVRTGRGLSVYKSNRLLIEGPVIFFVRVELILILGYVAIVCVATFDNHCRNSLLGCLEFISGNCRGIINVEVICSDLSMELRTQNYQSLFVCLWPGQIESDLLRG